MGFSLVPVMFLPVWAPAAASPLIAVGSLTDTAPTLVEAVRARGGGHVWGRAAARGPYGAVARGPQGNVAAVRRGAVVRPGAVAPGWRRPAAYWWHPGGAIAAGAAVGFVTAAAAASYAGSPPAAGYCWFYTNPQRTQGF